MENKSTKAGILVVDDSPAIRKSLINLLEPLDANIVEAENGKIALNQAINHNFDVIISDIDMPVMDGIEFCRELKNRPETRGIPVIVVSAFDSEEDVNKGFQAGAADYLSKDHAKEQLCDKVKEVMKKAGFQRRQVIMVVDDSETIRHVVQNGLEKNGYQTITAENGQQAMDLLKNIKPDLILSDIDMPVMNGFRFREIVRSKHEFSDIPFIVMSANNDRGSMKRMLKYGASAYICKPFNIDQLVIMVEKTLSDQFLMLFHEKERLMSERNLMVASITSLVTALEARDAYTKGHSEAVGKIVSGMLALSGADRIEIENGLLGGRLHDIGKIGITDSILFKEGRLTKEEFHKIKMHPVIGAGILEPIPSLHNIVDMVKHHHERMDGAGYPDGLKGSRIPLWARMTAVADTFHALTSDRPYRKACCRENALQTIIDEKGRQLCPDCVSLFLQYIEKNSSESDTGRKDK
ncbi:MAG: response regulator [Pseudomonadota bacterium]